MAFKAGKVMKSMKSTLKGKSRKTKTTGKGKGKGKGKTRKSVAEAKPLLKDDDTVIATDTEADAEALTDHEGPNVCKPKKERLPKAPRARPLREVVLGSLGDKTVKEVLVGAKQDEAAAAGAMKNAEKLQKEAEEEAVKIDEVEARLKAKAAEAKKQYHEAREEARVKRLHALQKGAVVASHMKSLAKATHVVKILEGELQHGEKLCQFQEAKRLAHENSRAVEEAIKEALHEVNKVKSEALKQYKIHEAESIRKIEKHGDAVREAKNARRLAMQKKKLELRASKALDAEAKLELKRIKKEVKLFSRVTAKAGRRARTVPTVDIVKPCLEQASAQSTAFPADAVSASSRALDVLFGGDTDAEAEATVTASFDPTVRDSS